jgi:hypothetical protein
MTKRGRLIVIAVSIAILLSAFGLPVTAYGSQNSGQSNPGGYVKYTLDLINNTLINGSFVNTGNALSHGGLRTTRPMVTFTSPILLQAPLV